MVNFLVHYLTHFLCNVVLLPLKRSYTRPPSPPPLHIHRNLLLRIMDKKKISGYFLPSLAISRLIAPRPNWLYMKYLASTHDCVCVAPKLILGRTGSYFFVFFFIIFFLFCLVFFSRCVNFFCVVVLMLHVVSYF